MNATYQKLTASIASTLPRLVSEETGVVVAWEPSPVAKNRYWVTLIESYKSKRVKTSMITNLDKVNEIFVGHVEQAERMKAHSSSRRAALSILKESFLSKLTVGTILHGSWGYEQTNCEYFVVREVTGSKVKIQEIGHKIVQETSWASAQVIPNVDDVRGEILDRLVVSNYIKLHNSCSLSLWDGKANYSSWYY